MKRNVRAIFLVQNDWFGGCMKSTEIYQRQCAHSGPNLRGKKRRKREKKKAEIEKKTAREEKRETWRW